MTKSILEIAKECGAAVHGPFVVEVPGGSVTQCFTTFSHEQLQSFATKLREEAKAEQIRKDAEICGRAQGELPAQYRYACSAIGFAILAQLPPPPAQRQGSDG